MPFAWSMLRNPEPTALAAARALAHRAVQWPTRAARANLAPVPDDSHTALSWDPARAALVSAPLRKDVRVGLRMGIHELIFMKGRNVESLALAGVTEAETGRWLDKRLEREGLEPASGVKLPYDLPRTLFGRPAEEAPALATLAGWFAAGAEVLEELRKKLAKLKPGPSPVRCWPHHFDIAILVALESGDPEHAKSIGIGLSPGDDYYAQPYVYLTPYPKPDTENLPALPPGGRWHTRDFFGAVATGTDLFVLPDPRKALMAIIEAAFDESLRRLDGR
jgi:hypothetical protein